MGLVSLTMMVKIGIVVLSAVTGIMPLQNAGTSPPCNGWQGLSNELWATECDCFPRHVNRFQIGRASCRERVLNLV